jgi:hypothetical protein
MSLTTHIEGWMAVRQERRAWDIVYWTVHWLSLGSLSVTDINALCVGLERTDDQILARCLDDLFSDQPQIIVVRDALDLREQTLDQPGVAAHDARGRGHGLGIDDVIGIERQVELLPLVGHDMARSSAESVR